MRGKSKGSLLDFMTVCISILAILVVITVYFSLSELMMTKLDVSQVTRKYILRMETKGYLDASDKVALLSELTNLGMRDIELGGTTLEAVGYGETIRLCVKGNVMGQLPDTGSGWVNGFIQQSFVLEEKRMSTAKN